MSSPSGGGKARGVHNCGRCDGDILRAVQAFSLSGDPGAFDGLDCTCRRLWEMTLEEEDELHQAGGIDIAHRLFKNL
jgi:radical SAM enzyme (TIGR01210 family)